MATHGRRKASSQQSPNNGAFSVLREFSDADEEEGDKIFEATTTDKGSSETFRRTRKGIDSPSPSWCILLSLCALNSDPVLDGLQHVAPPVVPPAALALVPLAAASLPVADEDAAVVAGVGAAQVAADAALLLVAHAVEGARLRVPGARAVLEALALAVHVARGVAADGADEVPPGTDVVGRGA